MRPQLPPSLPLLVALAFTGTAPAAVTITSWTYETLTTLDSLAPTGGEATVASFNMNNGSTGSLGGVSFTAAATGNYRTSGPITMAYSVPATAWASGGSGSYTANSVLNTFGYTYPQNNGTLEFTGLTPDQDYTFQFILADSRGTGGTAPNGRVVQIFGATVNGADVIGSSSQLRYAYQGLEQYGVISATFTADASGKAAFIPRVFEANGTTAAGTQVNAIHIMTVPEPTIALLGGLGLLGLLRRRRV